MKMNKYLKELGLKWNDLPGNYNRHIKSDCPAADIRNKENSEGFCEYEFFSLDYSLALYIYPRLRYFRDNYAEIATPGCFCYDKNGKHIDNPNETNRRWLEVLDKMIKAFQYIIKEPDWNTSEEIHKIGKVIDEGLQLFAQYYNCLWY